MLNHFLPALAFLLPLLAAGPAAAQAAPSEGTARGLDPELSRRAVSTWGKHLVPVEIWLQRSEGEEPSRFAAVGNEHAEKRPLEVAGLAVDARTIWLPETDLERRFIARVAVGSPPQPARLQGAFLDAPGLVIRTDAPLPGLGPVEWGSVEFVPWKGAPEGLLALLPAFVRGGWALTLSRVSGDHHRLGSDLWVEAPGGALILDRELRAVGYSLSDRLGLEGKAGVWRGPEIASGPVFDFGDLERSKEALEKKLAPRALTVRGFYRREEEAEGQRSRRMMYRRYRDEDGRRNDFLATGYAVGPKRVLVNHALHRENAMRLERLVVTVGGEDRPGRFAGAFRHYHAFLLEIEGAPLEEHLDLGSSDRFSIGDPLIAAAADHRSGRRRDTFELNRVSDFLRGYRGVMEPILAHFPKPATLLLGVADHRLRGVVLEVNRESDDDEPHRSFRSRGEIDLRVVSAAELRELLQKGEAEHDPRLVPRPVEREKDHVWLGVEFQPISRDLARSHGVEIPTRGGEIGLIALVVHPASPAARAAVEPGDILLSLREDDEPEPTELRVGMDFNREEAFLDMLPDDVPDEVREEFLSNAGPPWRSPRNFLNEKLTRVGEGRKVELVYLRAGKERKAWITLEVAPPDFESARKFKSEDLGLTVKDLTYDVRTHYRLKEDAPGVVVAKVEPGGKASIAKVLPFEVLVSVNGKVMRGVEDFQRAVEEVSKREAGERLLELKLERMGKSRLARIRP